MVNDDVSSWLWEMLSDEDLLHFEFQFTRTSERNPEHTFRALRLSSFLRKKKDKMKRSEENPKHSTVSADGSWRKLRKREIFKAIAQR